jgi:hypothetical protein
MPYLSADDGGSGALQYLRSDLFRRPAIYANLPPHWTAPAFPVNALTVSSLIVVTSSARYLTAQDQRVLHAALRRSARTIRSSAATHG